jgi:hypothetical protein
MISAGAVLKKSVREDRALRGRNPSARIGDKAETAPASTFPGPVPDVGEKDNRCPGLSSVPSARCPGSPLPAPSACSRKAENPRPEGGTACAAESTPDGTEKGTVLEGSEKGQNYLRGCSFSNTPPQSSIFQNCKGAEDWLEFGLFVNWNGQGNPYNWREFREEMEAAKERAQHESARPEDCQIQVFGRVAEVERGGVFAGKNRKGIYYRYALEYQGLKILIQDKDTHNGKNQNVIIRATGEECLLQGFDQCHKNGLKFVRQKFGTAEKEKLTRVDVCLDLPGVSMEEFWAAHLEGRYITRSKSRGMGESTGKTVYFGSAPLILRIYDKLAEVNAKANPTKKLAMKMHRWGGKTPVCAVRVEFEIHREALKERGIDSVGDYYKKRADLVRYLTHEWIRLTETKPDRKNKNQSKAETLGVWKLVQDGFQNFAGNPVGESLAPLDKAKANVKDLLKQCSGTAYTAATHQGREIQSVDDLCEFLKENQDSVNAAIRKRISAV